MRKIFVLMMEVGRFDLYPPVPQFEGWKYRQREAAQSHDFKLQPENYLRTFIFAAHHTTTYT